MPPSTATHVRPGSRLTAPTRYSVTPARPTRHRPGSSQTSGSGSPAADERFAGGGGRDARELGRFRYVVVGVVADPEAAAEVGDACFPAELVTARGGERGEASDGLRLRGEVGKLRADVDVEAEDVEAACERFGDGAACLRRRQAELRAVVPGHDRLVRVGVDTERDADEHPLDACGCRERGLVGRVEHDGSVLVGGLAEQRVVLVVPVHDELGSREPGAARERELARRPPRRRRRPRRGAVAAPRRWERPSFRRRHAPAHRLPLSAPGPGAESSPRSRRRAACRIGPPAPRPTRRRRQAHPRRSGPSPGRARASPDSAWYRFRLVTELLA